MKDKTLKQLVESIKVSGQPKTSAYDTSATVTRVEGQTAWVHIPGGVRETPVKLTINAKAGDNVQVRVSGGRAFMVGNATAPPTDDRVATQALTETRTVDKVVRTVQKLAEKTARIAGNTNQYFWHVQEGTDTGAHITEIPQEEFLADPTNGGGNLLARSNGIAARDGLTELAVFDSNGIQIGTATATRILLDTVNGLKLGNKIQLSPSGDASFTGTITGSSGEFTEGFLVKISSDTSQYGDYDYQFIVDPDVDSIRMEAGDNRFEASGSGILGYSNYGNISLQAYSDNSDIYLYSSGSGNTPYFSGGLMKSNKIEIYTGRMGATTSEIYSKIDLTSDGIDTTGKITSMGNILPDQTNTRYLGNTTYRWQNLYTHYVNASAAITAGAVVSYTPTWASGQSPAKSKCVVSAGLCIFSFQGAAVAHAANATLCTLPVGARPTHETDIPFVKMPGDVMGVIRISTAGVVTVLNISSTSATGRIYFSGSFPVV